MPKSAKDIVVAARDVRRGNRVTKSQYTERLDECKKCIYLLKALDVCRKCGCFVKAKAMSPSMTCPIGKWSLPTGDATVDASKSDTGNHDAHKEH